MYNIRLLAKSPKVGLRKIREVTPPLRIKHPWLIVTKIGFKTRLFLAFVVYKIGLTATRPLKSGAHFSKSGAHLNSI